MAVRRKNLIAARTFGAGTTAIDGSGTNRGEVKVLGVWEVFPGETLDKIVGSYYLQSRAPSSLNDLYECDIYMLGLPYSLFQTYLDNDNDLDSMPTYPTTLGHLDARAAEILFDYELGGVDYYSQGQSDDPEPKAGVDADTDPVGENLVESDNPEALADFMGPIGVTRFGSAELLIPPWAAISPNTGHYRFASQLNMNFGVRGPYYVLMILRRSFQSTDASQLDLGILATLSKGRISALNRLRGGDVHRNQYGLIHGGEAWTNEVGSILFAPERIVEGAGLIGSVDNSSGVGVFNAGIKCSAFISTPYSLTQPV